MSGEMDPVLAAIARLDDRVGRMDERISGLDERLVGMRDELTRLRVDVMARLDRQQDFLGSIRDDIGVNMAATDRAREANVETRKDVAQLTEQVSLIHRRLIRLEERVDRKDGGA